METEKDVQPVSSGELEKEALAELMPLGESYIEALKPFKAAGIDVGELTELLHGATSIEQFRKVKERIDAASKLVETYRDVHFKEALTLAQLVAPVVDSLLAVSGLDMTQAITCAYYAIGTCGLSELYRYPILAIQGALSTGKTQAMKIMQQVVNNPVLLSTTPSKATLRDKLGNNTTAVIEEADKIDEELISNRCERNTAKAPFKIARSYGGWIDTEAKYFGATVLHKRNAFKDPATGSRSIIINTRRRPKSYKIDLVVPIKPGGLNLIWEKARQHLPDCLGEGRVGVFRQPLVAVAMALFDIRWLAYNTREQKKAQDSLEFGQQFEIQQAVVSALMTLKDQDYGEEKLLSLTRIRDWVNKEFDRTETAWGIGSTLRELDFEIRKSHGQQKVVVDAQKIKEAAKEIGISEETD